MSFKFHYFRKMIKFWKGYSFLTNFRLSIEVFRYRDQSAPRNEIEKKGTKYFNQMFKKERMIYYVEDQTHVNRGTTARQSKYLSQYTTKTMILVMLYYIFKHLIKSNHLCIVIKISPFVVKSIISTTPIVSNSV
jgi:hypothetical protein